MLAAGLRADLAVEMIPYTPQELIAIGEQEFAWIDEQLLITSRRMGYGDDWKAALEHTKNLAPPPGEAPWAIYEIAKYSEDFVAKQHNITLAPLAREVGFQGLSMRASVVSVDSPPERVAAVRRLLDETGLAVSMVTGDVALAANRFQKRLG